MECFLFMCMYACITVAYQLNTDYFLCQRLLRLRDCPTIALTCRCVYSPLMILLSIQTLLCAEIACAQILKFSLRWDSPTAPQNSTPGAVELAYRYSNQFRWSTIDSFQVKSCFCSSPLPCGDIVINLASVGVDVTRPVQFRWLQRGQPSPYMWSMDTISFRGSIYDDFEDQVYPK